MDRGAFGAMMEQFEGPSLERIERKRARWGSRYTLGELAQTDFPNAEPIVGSLLRRGHRTIIAGHTGHGKTTFTMAMIAAVARGEPFMGEHVRQGKVLYIDLEQDPNTIKRRLQEILYPGTYPKKSLFHYLTNDRSSIAKSLEILTIPDGIALDEPGGVDQQEFESLMRDYAPSVVVIDPLFKTIRGNVNNDDSVLEAVRFIDGLRSDIAFGLVLPAHVRKGQGDPQLPELTDIRGVADIAFGAEIVLAIHRDKGRKSKLRFLKERWGDVQIPSEHEMEWHPTHGWRLSSGTRGLGRRMSYIEMVMEALPLTEADARTYHEMQAFIQRKHGLTLDRDTLRASMSQARSRFPEEIMVIEAPRAEGQFSGSEPSKYWRNPVEAISYE